MRPINKQLKRGFSLLELSIVVMILGVITTIAIPKFADAGSGRKLSAAKKTLTADIEMAKLHAQATSKVHVIKFYPEKNFYVIVEGDVIERSSVVLKRDFSQAPYELNIANTTLGDDATASITVYGDVSPGFQVGLVENGTEVVVDINGIADSGLTIVDNLPVDEVSALKEVVGWVKAAFK